MAYMVDRYTAAERGLVWREGEGCVGRAWQSQETVIYPSDDEAPVTVADADRPTPPWRMTREQIHATAGRVRSAIATPIPHPDMHGEVIGVLVLDSSDHLADSSLDSAGKVLEELRTPCGRLLDQAGLRFPPGDADSDRRDR